MFSRGLEIDKAILNRLEHNSETICILDKADCSEIIINKELLELIKGHYRDRIRRAEGIG